MLVLSRRRQEQIVIGGVVLTILDLGDGRVKLGIAAPVSVSIVRAELLPTDPRGGAEAPPIPGPLRNSRKQAGCHE